MTIRNSSDRNSNTSSRLRQPKEVSMPRSFSFSISKPTEASCFAESDENLETPSLKRPRYNDSKNDISVCQWKQNGPKSKITIETCSADIKPTHLISTSSVRVGIGRKDLPAVDNTLVGQGFSPLTVPPYRGTRDKFNAVARLKDTEIYVQELRRHIERSNNEFLKHADELFKRDDQIRNLNKIKGILESKVEDNERNHNAITCIKDQEIKRCSEEIDVLKDKLRITEALQNENIGIITKKLENQACELRDELEAKKLDCASSKSLLELAEKDLANLNRKLDVYNERISQMETEIQDFRGKNGDLSGVNLALKGQISSLLEEVQQNKRTISDLESQLIEGEKSRRHLHNTIQELKGNIRVFCRFRPPLGCDNPNIDHISFKNNAFHHPDEIEITQALDPLPGSTKLLSKSYKFTFDRIFGPLSSQQDVFEEISQLVQSSLDGYNVCIFAYGQTGSGKTYTMEGLQDESPLNSRSGMIPRSICQIFETSRSLKAKGWNHIIKMSFLEIYNEMFNDLLVSDGVEDSVENVIDLSESKTNNEKLEVKHLNNGKTTVKNLGVFQVLSEKGANILLKRALSNRSIGETQCNEKSSRSHSVFMLNIEGCNSVTGEKIEGQLNLVDLAGSERLSSSGSTGERLKETQAINKSLSSLCDVIIALINRDQHIPYRNSKLTYLLQNSLGGNSKTLMFVNASPEYSTFNETLSSLRFASKVNSCQIGTAKKIHQNVIL